MNKSILKNTIYIIVLVIIWIYGIGIGKFQIFPYKQIISIFDLLQNKEIENNILYIEHEYMVDMFNTFIPDSDITMVGDSITYGIDWTDVFPEKVIVNRGIKGDRTNDVYDRLDSIITTKPEKVFILIGLNDLFSSISVEEIFLNYKKIIEGLNKHNISIYIQSTLNIGNALDENIIKINNEINLLNSYLKDYCENNNITYIDLNEKLSKDGVLLNDITIDGVHLNSKGYLLWKEKILPYIY